MIQLSPDEKAMELLDKFKNPTTSIHGVSFKSDRIKCAMILAEEVINETPMYLGGLNPKFQYWTEVRNVLKQIKSANEANQGS